MTNSFNNLDGGGATVSNVADAIMWTADVGSKGKRTSASH